MFTDPLFTALPVRTARLIAPWNSAFAEPEQLDQWLNAAREAGIEPLVAFEHARGGSCSYGPCGLPSADSYAAAVREFHRRYPWVKLITPWNEPNHESQPTAAHPRRAAGFYNEARAACPGCTVVAGDVLDAPGMEGWVRDYSEGLAERPAVWGIHNYYDVTRFRTSGIESFLALVQGDVWLTEVGGLVHRRTLDGRIVHPYDEARAERSMMLAFHIAHRFRDRVSRMYIYQWRARPDARFDAGLIRADGSPRPSYQVVRREAGGPSHARGAVPEAGLEDAGLRIDLSGLTLTRAGLLRFPLACSPRAAGHCSGRIMIEDVAYRRARLVNGRPRAGMLQPLARQIRLSRSALGSASFRLPRRVVRDLGRLADPRLRITIADQSGARPQESIARFQSQD